MERALRGTSQPWWLLGLFLLLPIGLWGCAPLSQERAAISDRVGCVADYDPAADYFPAKVRVERALGFAVEYGPNYKLVTVKQPWPGAQQEFRYLLVQCGTPVPEGF
ncbi:MAG: ABC transporter substrate-binding protein, partial [Cyanobacteria bacterium J06641_5]